MKKPIVYTFGCSWTHGCKEAEIGTMSWVLQLAKKYPNIEFRNFALVGSSLEFSLAHLADVVKNYPPGLKIFQITAPYRFTVWDQKEISKSRHAVNNVLQYNPKAVEKTERYHGGWNANRIREDKNFWKMYATKNNVEAEKAKFLACCDYVKRNTDFSFYHMRYGGISDNSIPCVKDEIGSDQFDNYCWDEGFHFGPEGCQWVADWIESKVKIQ